MSANPTPGLHRVELKHRPFSIATKITGRNTASVSYIVALEAERRGVELALVTAFGPTGELQQMGVIEHQGGVPVALTELPAGGYLVLQHDEVEANVLTEAEYAEYFQRRD